LRITLDANNKPHNNPTVKEFKENEQAYGFVDQLLRAIVVATQFSPCSKKYVN